MVYKQKIVNTNTGVGGNQAGYKEMSSILADQ